MVRVLDAKSDCSRRGEAEVCILNFKTTWSEFLSPPQSRSQAAVCVSTPRMYPRSGYFLVFPIVYLVSYVSLVLTIRSSTFTMGSSPFLCSKHVPFYSSLQLKSTLSNVVRESNEDLLRKYGIHTAKVLSSKLSAKKKLIIFVFAFDMILGQIFQYLVQYIIKQFISNGN